MKRVFEAMSALPNDKLLHFFYGSLFSFVAFHFMDGLVAFDFMDGLVAFHFIDGLAAFWTVFGLAIAKEVYDVSITKFTKLTRFSILDVVATVAPAIMHLGLINL